MKWKYEAAAKIHEALQKWVPEGWQVFVGPNRAFAGRLHVYFESWRESWGSMSTHIDIDRPLEEGLELLKKDFETYKTDRGIL